MIRRDRREVLRQHIAHVLGIASLWERGETDQVAEQDRDEPALKLRRHRLMQGRAASAAEPGPLRCLRSTPLAVDRYQPSVGGSGARSAVK